MSEEPALRIVVADDEADMRDFFHKVLSHLGHEVVGIAEDGLALVRHCREQRPDLVITDIIMPEMNGLEALREVGRDQAIPSILVSAHQDDEFIKQAAKERVLAYLVKPIKKDDLAPAIALVMQRYREFEALQRQADDLRQALADRKLVEQAKGILMQRAGLSEPDAFRRLQTLSNNRNKKMVDVARTIVDAEEAFLPTS